MGNLHGGKGMTSELYFSAGRKKCLIMYLFLLDFAGAKDALRSQNLTVGAVN